MAVQKIKDDHDFFVREAIEKADLSSIVDIAQLTFIRALTDQSIFEELQYYFSSMLDKVTINKITYDDYDYIMQATLIVDDREEASDFLAGCKLFIKQSSDYELCVDNETYIFRFNIDRVDVVDEDDD